MRGWTGTRLAPAPGRDAGRSHTARKGRERLCSGHGLRNPRSHIRHHIDVSGEAGGQAEVVHVHPPGVRGDQRLVPAHEFLHPVALALAQAQPPSARVLVAAGARLTQGAAAVEVVRARPACCGRVVTGDAPHRRGGLAQHSLIVAGGRLPLGVMLPGDGRRRLWFLLLNGLRARGRCPVDLHGAEVERPRRGRALHRARDAHGLPWALLAVRRRLPALRCMRRRAPRTPRVHLLGVWRRLRHGRRVGHGLVRWRPVHPAVCCGGRGDRACTGRGGAAVRIEEGAAEHDAHGRGRRGSARGHLGSRAAAGHGGSRVS
mmetsp:Transcript_47336/g.137902  ORF Transcript_47336/g.137902 Transcript_47336/m.137902 type:complete len:317 (-) Transcript_47336:28-978(-)